METNSAYATNQVSTPERQPEVSGELEKLATQCEILDKQFAELETRLVKVLAQRSENATADKAGAPEPVRVPLAQTIHDRVLHLCALSAQLRSIINRVEL